MTKDEYKKKFEYHAIDWQISSEGVLRAMINGYKVCPLTGICYIETGKFYPVCDAFRAGKELGLSDELIEYIANIADMYPRPSEQEIEGDLKLDFINRLG